MSKRKASNYSEKSNEYFWKNPLTENQKTFVQLMDEKRVVIASGASGVGKTLFALQTGLKLLDQRYIDQIYYIRCDPLNRFGTKALGALPGEMADKLLPLLGPIADNIIELCSPGKAKYIMDNGLIEVIPLEYVRGRSFANSYVIVDELQNFSIEAVKMVLTRISRNTQMVLLGDITQKDSLDRFTNGLADAVQRLDGLNSVGIVKFGISDVLRDPVVKDILMRYA